MKWTKDQQRVIDLRNRNILVSAAAGSGKTAVLVERIIQKILDETKPIQVDQLLVVTFTEAAAAEMKERIGKAIEAKCLEDPSNVYLEQQRSLLHSARIMTIHSFCLSIIRDYFFVIDLEPDFHIGEEGELKLLRQEVMEELLEEKYEEQEEGFLNLIDGYGNGGDASIVSLVFRIYDYARSYPDWKGWLNRQKEVYQITTEEELEGSDLGKYLMEKHRECIKEARKLWQQAMEILEQEGGPIHYQKALASDEALLDEISRISNLSDLFQGYQDLKWSSLPGGRKPKEVDATLMERAREIRNEMKEEVGGWKDKFFTGTMEEVLEDFSLCKESIRNLIDFVFAFGKEFEAKKREKHLIDFSDMEQYALEILTEQKGGNFFPTQVAELFQNRFEEIMVDEYQDSNLIQETILRSISKESRGERNLFMVGDVKQSIYKFRLSRPQLFLEKYKTYSLEEGECQRIDLHQNFRSRNQVLDGVNFFFYQWMREEFGGISYSEEVALHPGAGYPENSDCEMEILCVESKTEKALSSREGMKVEAALVANRIQGLMSSQMVTEKSGELRPIRYQDIVILARSVKGMADIFVEELEKRGIPVHAQSKEGYFSTLEIRCLIQYLKLVDNRRQDIPLATVLTSPMCGLNERQLGEIRGMTPSGTFFESVERYRREGENLAIRKRLEGCFSLLEEFEKKAAYTPIYSLLCEILKKTGYGYYMWAMPSGKQRKANLELLLEKARTFDSTSYQGIYQFVRYMEQLDKNEVEYGEAGTEEEHADVVRILTIHKSKGLEFPVVFVSGLGKKMNQQDGKASVCLHIDRGIGLDAVDLEKRTKRKSLVKAVIQEEEKLDSKAEELRVLYVALTRAKEKLILTGCLEEIEEKRNKARRLSQEKDLPLPTKILERANTYWDFILPAYGRKEEEAPLRFLSLLPSEIQQVEWENLKDTLEKQEEFKSWIGEVHDIELARVLEEQAAFVYPYEEMGRKKRKYTVSELKKGRGEVEGEVLFTQPKRKEETRLPKFLQGEEKKKGAYLGTLYHKVMEVLDLRNTRSSELKHQIKDFVERGVLEEEVLELVDCANLEHLFETSLGKKMKQAYVEGRLKREQPFLMEEEGALIQGVIDAWWEEGEEIYLVDYKTDRVTEEVLKERYQIQLDYYGKALEKGSGKKIGEACIYSFFLKKWIHCVDK